MAGALEDLLVLEISQGWSAALCGRLFAELGAEVVKIEPPEGDPLRRLGPAKHGVGYLFELANVNKKSAVLDLAQHDHQRAFRELIKRADILIEDLPQEQVRRLGLDATDLEQLNPGLIACSITPYGRIGPLSGWAGSDLTIQAMSGMMATTGFPTSPPTKAGLRIAEGIGAIFAAVGTLAALTNRDRTGLGQWVDISLLDCMIAAMMNQATMYTCTGESPGRVGNRHTIPHYCWNAFPAKDGWVFIIGTHDVQMSLILKAIGRDNILGGGGAAAMAKLHEKMSMDEFEGWVSEWTRTKTVAEAAEAMEAARTPAGPIFTIAQLLNDEQSRSRGMVVELDHPIAGKMRYGGSVFTMSETPGKVLRPAPALGAHTSEILERLKAGVADPPQDPAAAPRALEGVRVVEFGLATTGPLACKFLASLGAEVVKAEPPKGVQDRGFEPSLNGEGYNFNFTHNPDKKGITLNTDTERGRALAKELVKQADVFVENFSSGRMESLGMGYDDLRQINPRLVYASITGFGQTGPMGKKRAYDTVIQGRAGILSLTGFPGEPPVKTGISTSDMLGAILGPVQILAAVHYARRTGIGQYIDVAMYDVTGWLTQEAWPLYFESGQAPKAIGNRDRYHAPHNSYQAKDGWVVIAVESEEQWRGLAAAIGRPELARDPRFNSPAKRVAAADELDALIAAWVKEGTRDAVVQICQEHHVPAAPILEVEETLHHPHTVSRQMYGDIQHPTMGPVKGIGSPFKLSRTPGRVKRSAPRVGEHNQEVFSRLGLTQREQEQLKAEGVI